MKHLLVISKGTEYLRIPVAQLIFISAQGNYSEVVLHDGRKLLVAYQLGHIADMLDNQFGKHDGRLIRIGRSLIVNKEYIHIIDSAKQQIDLSDCHDCYYELNAPREALAGYKAYLAALDEK